MSFGSLVQLGFNSAAGPKSVSVGSLQCEGTIEMEELSLDETNVGLKFVGFPLSLGWCHIRRPLKQAGGCSHSDIFVSFELWVSFAPRLASSQEHLRWLHVCKCLASMELSGVFVWGWRFPDKNWCTHVFFSHSNNLVGWLIRVSGMILSSTYTERAYEPTDI